MSHIITAVEGIHTTNFVEVIHITSSIRAIVDRLGNQAGFRFSRIREPESILD